MSRQNAEQHNDPLGVVTEPDIDAVCRILENTLSEVADAVEATTTHE